MKSWKWFHFSYKIVLMNKQMENRMIIMDHYQKPHNFIERIEMGTVQTFQKKNCADEFQILIEWENDKVTNTKFTGKGCAVSTASLDLLLSAIQNKTKEQIISILDKYKLVIDKGQTDVELGQLNIFDTVYKIENRKSCASLGLETIRKIMEGE